MTDLSEGISKNIGYLRRYARALTGSQKSGDSYVRVCLEVLLHDRGRISASGDVRRQLFALFHDVWRTASPSANAERAADRAIPENLSVEARLEALPPRERQVLLLTALEGFSVYESAEILGVSEDAARELLATAWTAVNEQLSTTVLIIEDEPIIALDIAGLVRDMGHDVVGVAANEREAVTMARAKSPGLVLADINLGSGGSGLKAVKTILQSIEVPVIFVTAFPERLLTGERPEPTYLVTKPFEPDMLRVTISQALASRPAVGAASV